MNESKELIAISAFMTWVNSESTGHSAVDSLLQEQQQDKAEAINTDDNIGKPSPEVIQANTQFAPQMTFNQPKTGDDAVEPVVEPSLSSMSSKLSWMDDEGGDTKEALIEDVASVEKTLGSKEDATAGAEIVAEQLVKATEYPTTPIPEKASSSEFDSMISLFIGDD